MDAINRGACPFYEKGLEAMLRKNLNVRLMATTDLRRSVLKRISRSSPWAPHSTADRLI